MITIDMFELGEEVFIKAKVTDIMVENGEIKYKIKCEHSNNDLDHKFTDKQLFVFEKNSDEEKSENVSES